MDYEKLLDKETWKFIHKIQSFYPKDINNKPIKEQRRAYNLMCKAFYMGRPEGVLSKDVYLSNVLVRKYLKTRKTIFNFKNARVIFFHGGGFVVGGLDSHDDICAEICFSTEMEVCAVDYSLAPENNHPQIFEDAMKVVKHFLTNHSEQIILCGDSAGGGLAASVAHSIRDNMINRHKIAGQLLIYPALGGEINKSSYITFSNAPLLSREDVMNFMDIALGRDNPTTISNLNPLGDKDFSQLPPTIIYTANFDPLRDDGQKYCEAINESGGEALWINEKGLIHGYLRARNCVKKARESFNTILKNLIALAENRSCIIKNGDGGENGRN